MIILKYVDHRGKGLAWPGFGSRGNTGLTSEKKLPLCATALNERFKVA